MRKFNLTAILLLGMLTLSTSAQERVEVSAEFVADANKAFELVVAQREAIAALKATIEAKGTVIEAKNETIEVKNKAIERLERVKCSRGSFLLFVIKWKKCS